MLFLFHNKDKSCFIKGYCFAPNEPNPKDWCQQCIPEINKADWTKRQGTFDKMLVISFTVTTVNGDHFHIRGGIEGCHWSILGNSIFPKTFCKTYFEMMYILMNFISSEGCHFHAITNRRKAWFHLRMSRILFALKHS